MRVAVIVAVVLAVAAGAVAHAEPRARVTIKNGAGWPSHDKTIAVRVDGGAWHKIASGRTSRRIAIAAPATGRAVAFDVRAPKTGKPFRRWALVMPGITYQVVGNPCAFWGLNVIRDRDPDGEYVPERIQVDTTQVAPSLFPLVIATTLGDNEPELGETGLVVDKPGVSAPVELMVSAMCMRSGTPVVVYSRGAKRRIFDETIIGHPGALHTLRLEKAGGFSLVVAPAK